MRKPILLGSFLTLSMGINAQINSFPFVEDFEGQTLGPTGCGPSYTFTGTTWMNGDDAGSVTHQTDWTVDNGGTSSSGTGPSIDHTLGTNSGNYIYAETSCSGSGYPNRTWELWSPFLDFSGTTTNMELTFWYHAFGGTTGNLNIEARIGTVGPLATWTNIGGPITDNIDLWQKAQICFPGGFTGVDSVQIRFVYVSGTSFTGDFGLDDISVQEIFPNDIKSLAALATGGCGLSNMEPVGINIQNFGSMDILSGTTIPVSYQVNGGTVVTETMTTSATLNGKCNGAGTETYMFTTMADFSIPGTYTIAVWTNYTGDGLPSNDTAWITINSIPLISNLPYKEDFESGNGGWLMNNSNNGTWSFGTPAHAVINSAASGDSAFVTGFGATAPATYNPNENSWVESPCMDITTANGAEYVALKIWYESEFSWDGANLFASYDGGSTWSQVGSFGSLQGDHWYNDNTINGTPGGSQQGWTGRNNSNNGSSTWICATHKLDSALMVDSSSLKFRVYFGTDGSVQDEGFAFDDFAIGYPFAYDPFPDTLIVCDTITSIMLDAGSGYEFYHWGNDNSHNQTYTANGTGTYTVWVSDTNGMCSRDQIYVEFRNFVKPNLQDLTVCIGDSGIFVAPFDTLYTYQWNNGETSDTAYFITPGMVNLIQTDTSNGCVANDTAMLFNNTPVSITDMSACMGDTLVFDATTINAAYSWSTGETTSTINITSNQLVEVYATDTILGCMSADTAMATFYTLPVISLNDSAICADQSYTLDAGVASTYIWNTGDTTQTITVDGSTLGSGTFNYDVTITDTNGCMNTDTMLLVVNMLPSPVISGAADTLCFTQSLNLDAGSGFNSYQWSTGGTSQTETITGSGLSLGSNTIIVTVSDNNSCTNSDTVSVYVDQCASIDENLLGFSVYPNPARDLIQFRIENGTNQATVSISDLNGKLLIYKSFNGPVGNMDISELSKGIYLVSIEVKGAMNTLKLIKE